MQLMPIQEQFLGMHLARLTGATHRQYLVVDLVLEGLDHTHHVIIIRNECYFDAIIYLQTSLLAQVLDVTHDFPHHSFGAEFIIELSVHSNAWRSANDTADCLNIQFLSHNSAELFPVRISDV